MEKTENKKEIHMKCFCNEEDCKGSLHIQPDIVDGEKIFIVSVIDGDSICSSSIWLSFKQLRQLRKDISTLFSELAIRE